MRPVMQKCTCCSQVTLQGQFTGDSHRPCHSAFPSIAPATRPTETKMQIFLLMSTFRKFSHILLPLLSAGVGDKRIIRRRSAKRTERRRLERATGYPYSPTLPHAAKRLASHRRTIATRRLRKCEQKPTTENPRCAMRVLLGQFWVTLANIQRDGMLAGHLTRHSR